MPYSQDDRLIAVDTPLGKDVLLLTAFTGKEGVSSLFNFELNMLSEKRSISFEAIIGKKATISVILADGSKRYFNGHISRFSQGRGGGESEKASAARLTSYRATMVPWLWLLTRTADSRIFQKLSVPEIVKKIFDEKSFLDYKDKLQKQYNKRDYCVQYRETDLNFVSRLMEEEGIYYFFEHEDGKHTLILADACDEHKPCPKQAKARYQLTTGGWLKEDVITGVEKSMEIRAGKYTLNEYNFEIPKTDLKVEVPSKVKLGPGEREVYDYPGGYGKRKDGDTLTKLRMEEEEAQIETITGTSICRAFTSGYRFKLEDHYRGDVNKDYVLTSIQHDAAYVGDYISGSGDEGFSYENYFSCIPFDVPYRPARMTPKPVVEGTQTAIVVGPAGEEIYPDEHGRVKVQFHWDREGKRDENSSCWIRVGQLWAGPNWGGLFIPRIGQEVIVHFLEGDPDRPIIVGCVYHGNNKPPYPLPDEKTKSTIKSDSSLGGGGFNEFRFEDKKGQEEVYLHGQKDQTIVIENDRDETIGRDRRLDVGRDKSEIVHRNKSIQVIGGHTEQIGSSMSIIVGSTLTETVAINYAETVGGAMELTVGGAVAITVGAAMAETVGGEKTESIGMEKSQNIGGNKAINVGKDLSETVAKNKAVTVGNDLNEKVGGQHKESVEKEYVLNAKKVQLIAREEVNIKTGQAEIIMKKSGDITIKGKKISVKGSGNVIIKGSQIKEN